MGQYDKLGALLKDAIDSGDLDKDKKETKTTQNSEKEAVYSPEEKSETVAEKNAFPDEALPFLRILGFENTGCSPEAVKNSYRKLLKKYHPDNIPDYPAMQKTASKKTQEIVEAYKKLSEYL